MRIDDAKTRKTEDGVSRRTFLRNAASAAATMAILPRRVLGGSAAVAPSDKITIACVGVGAQGTRVMMDFLKEPDVQIVSVCDVNKESSDYSEWDTNELRNKERALLGKGHEDWGHDWKGPTAGREPARRLVEAYYASRSSSGQYRGCSAYNDFREMLAKEKDLDAVIVCTPDHWHALVSVTAMRQKKHVYCQKPMTHSILESRRMAEVARETGVATQVAVGNQSSEATRELEEWIAAGVIGPARRVDNWSTRPFWPQGINRPAQEEPVPEGLDWDLWLGPAPARPFNHAYLPFVWRGWYDFGTGALGDMGCYSFDTLFRALKLGAPVNVEASSTQLFPETYPAASIIYFDFPARGEMPPVRVTWYDGGLRPPRPPELEPGREMGEEKEGMLIYGDAGTIMCGFEGENPKLIPESRMKQFTPPPKTLPRSPGHNREWLNAIKGGPAPGANFEFESLVTESLLVGNVAVRANAKVKWDGANLRATDPPDAQKFVPFDYRSGWSL